jgi:hypothetical protein
VRSASITSMIRHYVARRAQVTEGHPHNAEMSESHRAWRRRLTGTTWIRKGIREVPFRFTIELTVRLAGFAQTGDAESIAGR